MTTRTDTTLERPPGPPAHPPERPQQALRAGRDRRARARRPSATARRSTSPSSSTAPARCPARSCASPRRRSRRPSAGCSPTTGSASSSTTTWSTSSSTSTRALGRGAPRRDRPPRADRGPRQHEPRPRAGCAAASRSPAHLAERGVNRCLLLTDGLANVGITDAGRAGAGTPRELRARGVSTSTFGVGNDFDERLLQELADAGGGHFYYIADAPQIRDAITSEVGETLEVVARDVGARGHRARRHPDRADQPVPGRRPAANRTVVSLGDLGSEQVVEVVLRLSFPYGDIGRETGRHRRADRPRRRRSAGAPAAPEPVRLTWAYADDRGQRRAAARSRRSTGPSLGLFAARARQEAVRRNRERRLRRRPAGPGRDRGRIRGYAGDDPDLRAARSGTLASEEVVYAAPMAEASRKQAHFASANMPAQPRRARVTRSSAPDAPANRRVDGLIRSV